MPMTEQVSSKPSRVESQLRQGTKTFVSLTSELDCALSAVSASNLMVVSPNFASNFVLVSAFSAWEIVSDVAGLSD